ncbi:MAG: hypothetical protein K0V04_05970 [Deltaproteobacteria bacterium]|nr:hypothetical protein [Deltaproteobacteria bacterium]
MPFPNRPSATSSRLAPAEGGARRDGLVVLALIALVWAAACSPVVRPARFASAKDRVTDVTLRGPFDGQVVDETTAEPIQGAVVLAVWSYDQGDGLIGPAGSEVIELKTDQAGRYRVPEAPMRKRGPHLRLVSFDLIVYKRGYVGYRSDRHLDGTPRTDFALRHNRVQLRKWRDTDSHAEHLVFLAAPASVLQLASWEREAANLDLYRELGGEAAGPAGTDPEQPTAALQLLDATGLLAPEDVRRRTGYTDAFDIKELGDLARTHFYHGVHLQAVDRDEVWDVAYRVWQKPPGGLDPVVQTFEATLPQVGVTGEITSETWVYDSDQVRAVAFLDRDRDVGVLLTCGAMQCSDIETVIILASFVFDNLDDLTQVDAPTAPARVAAPPLEAKP